MNLKPAAEVALGRGHMTPMLFDERFGFEAKFGATITLVEQGGRLTVGVSHRGDRFGARDARLLGDCVASLLVAFSCGQADTPLEELALPSGRSG